MTKIELLEAAKPLICNKDVAKAFVDGRKTQTRRLPKGNNPRYKEGDILWIREPAKVTMAYESVKKMEYEYLSDGTTGKIDIPERFMDEHLSFADTKWIKLCRGVPNGCIKEMARIFYRVKDVRIERLQDITIGDIIDEGFNKDVSYFSLTTKQREDALLWWIDTWNRTATKGKKCGDDPLVEVYDLERVEQTGVLDG